MKYVYALLVTAALAVGCNAVPTQSTITRDIAQVIDNQQLLVVLSMAIQTGGGGDVDRAVAAANVNKYVIAQTRLANGVADNDIALNR
jgi:hypothetical protein